MNKSKLEDITRSGPKARENMRARVTIGFGFTSDWLKKWRGMFKPITERTNANTKQLANYFRNSTETRSHLKTKEKTNYFRLAIKNFSRIFDAFIIMIFHTRLSY